MLAFCTPVRLVHSGVVLVGLIFRILLARCPKSQEILLENYFFRSSKSLPSRLVYVLVIESIEVL